MYFYHNPNDPLKIKLFSLSVSVKHPAAFGFHIFVAT